MIQYVQVNCPTCGEELQAKITAKDVNTQRIEFSHGMDYVYRVGVAVQAFADHRCKDENPCR